MFYRLVVRVKLTTLRAFVKCKILVQSTIVIAISKEMYIDEYF